MPRRSRIAQGGAFAVAAVVSLLAAALAAALAPSAGAVTRPQGAVMRIGSRPTAPAGARVEGRLAVGARLHVDVTLRPRNPGALAAYARAVSTPGSAAYRQYLTPAQFRARFGPTAAQIATVRRALRARGLRPGPASAGGLSIPVVASAGLLEQAFSVSLQELALPGRRTAVIASERPAIAAGAAPLVQAVIGLNSTSPPHPLLVRGPQKAAVPATATPPRKPAARAHAATAAPAPCPQAQAAAPSQSAYTEDQIASAYGFSGVYSQGDLGAGVTVAIYELEPDDPSDIAAYQSCYGTHASISYVTVDGGVGSGAGGGEAALDIENLIGLAPNVRVLVYQGPNSDSNAPGSGPYDTFSAMINQNRARVISVSWGQCERAVGAANAQAENTLFQQAAVQGQSIVAADGDTGSEDCDTPAGIPDNQLGVDDPSSQPYVTGVGGTTLTALGPRPTETVWNSGGQQLPGTEQAGASGGGVSSLWSMPAEQLNAAPTLNVRSAQAASSACGSPSGYCREVPDVSADADPGTGYLIYWNGQGRIPGEPAGWQGIGGTSAASPVWAALFSLADASAACAKSPVGYAGPSLYQDASDNYAADFNDVTTGENDFTGTNGGRYSAGLGYDPASGLGTPNVQSLLSALCSDDVHLTVPHNQRSSVRAAVTLRLLAADATGEPVTYHVGTRSGGASQLPPGLRLNGSTGLISGHPTHAGRYTVSVTATDSAGSIAGGRFTWTVGDAAKISHVSLAPTAGGSQLAFTVAAGHNSPALQELAISVPRPLRLAAARHGIGIQSVGSRPVSLGFSHQVSHDTLTIKLRKATGTVRVTLSPPSLRGSAPHGRAASARRMLVSVVVIDSYAGRSRLTARVAEVAR